MKSLMLMKTPWYKTHPSQASWGNPAKTPKLKSPSCRQDNVSWKKYIDLSTNTQMLGSKRFSNHHLRKPDAKEIQEISTRKVFLLSRSKSQRPFYNEKLSPLNRNERCQNHNHFSNGWLRSKDTNVLINGWDELNIQYMDQYNHKVPKWTRSPIRGYPIQQEINKAHGGSMEC